MQHVEAQADEALQAPLLAGRYAACTCIGKGGTSSVYVVFDHLHSRWYAAKVLHGDAAEDPETLTRFAREAAVMSRISHPNVVRLVEMDLSFHPPFLVMDFLDAGSIGRWSRRHGPMPPAMMRRAVLDLCYGLTAIHALGAVHRDIKPGNLLLGRDSRAHIADFGIVALNGNDPLKVAGTVVGTLAYMAPEQRLETGQIDRRSDLFSVGATMVALLQGSPVPDASRLTATSPQLANLPPELRAIILTCCAFDPKDRYNDVDELIVALKALGVPPVPPAAPKLVPTLPPLPEEPPDLLTRDQAAGLATLRADMAGGSQRPASLPPVVLFSDVPGATGPRAARRWLWIVLAVVPLAAIGFAIAAALGIWIGVQL